MPSVRKVNEVKARKSQKGLNPSWHAGLHSNRSKNASNDCGDEFQHLCNGAPIYFYHFTQNLVVDNKVSQKSQISQKAII